ncbi:MAG: FKBP-type peptidyl-prolyl cis-trans isomerase [Alphaproteobacteria bacterium]|nr:MAG: FKBP-type peptidyl-prolyl cis-trans isomerase [Alphaproteobacteria bacterium]
MRRIPTLLVIATLVLTGCGGAAQQSPKTDEEKSLYALGVLLSRNIQSFEFTDKELDMVKQGVADGAKDKSQIDNEAIETLVPKLQELQKTRVAAATEKAKKDGVTALEKAAAEKGATKTASGLVYKETKAGDGAQPTASDQVKVHYEGKFTNGKVFDSSIKRNEPAVFPLTGVIPCWTEAVQLMKVGGKAQVTCPAELAYGEEGRPPQMPGGATLIFDVELLEIVKEDPAAAAGPGTAVPPPSSRP